jgi:hypothetical protein
MAKSFKRVTPSLEVLLESGLGEGLQLVVEVLGPCLEKYSALVNFDGDLQTRDLGWFLSLWKQLKRNSVSDLKKNWTGACTI